MVTKNNFEIIEIIENNRKEYPQEKRCFCHDGCIVPFFIVKNNNRKYELHGISVVFGQGHADYRKIIDNEFDEVVPLNSFSGKSYIVLRKNKKWGILELIDNSTPECELKTICDFMYENLHDMFEHIKIDYKWS
ncbi:MAG: hypothetical protein HQK77_19420 [Desulfobacterales bacterium]|nr:hypothetical protein [Desulfobacterales bacterium]